MHVRTHHLYSHMQVDFVGVVQVLDSFRGSKTTVELHKKECLFRLARVVAK